MFRELRRIKQKMTTEECNAILREEKRGVLSLQGDDGYPYGIPMDFWYDEAHQRIYFHGAREGHKIDSIKRSDKVSFCVYDQGYRNEGEWFYNVKSVIVFGRIKAVEDYEEAMQAVRQLGNRYTDDTAYVDKEIRVDGPHVLCLKIEIEHMSGKRVKEN